MSKFTDEQRYYIVEAYESGSTISQIAKELERSYQVVRSAVSSVWYDELKERVNERGTIEDFIENGGNDYLRSQSAPTEEETNESSEVVEPIDQQPDEPDEQVAELQDEQLDEQPDEQVVSEVESEVVDVVEDLTEEQDEQVDNTDTENTTDSVEEVIVADLGELPELEPIPF